MTTMTIELSVPVTVSLTDFVVFFCPGTLVSEVEEAPVEHWDTAHAVRLAESTEARYAAKPYAFRFEKRALVGAIDIPGVGVMAVGPKLMAKSPRHHLGGVVLTYEEIERRDDPNENILRSNMRSHTPVVVVNTNSYRSVQAFEPDDVMVDASGIIVRRGNDADLVAYRKRHEEENHARWDRERAERRAR